MKIVVDPGHDGYTDPGKCAGGVRECDVVISIAKYLCKELYERGYETLLTRSGNVPGITPQVRVELANANRVDALVSIHTNVAVSEEVSGTTSYYPAGSPESRQLADAIQECLVAALGTTNCGIREKELSVLTAVRCPVVLISVGFLSNPAERALLTDSERQQQAARAMAEGVEKYRMRRKRHYFFNG
ncbi:n-acetylmuramoyl-l-alanine amidase [Lucifera butyrica]|uniref:N-acetylmuramoyl-l-alanine amidase n=1 Tax=Lucifera butyrica TaxID=1351585 RepID=A0A498R1K2_9FIRM|nr:N-acetylmuramoyl-L-alanine amidase [Lucifera butyrica]VBB05035.1 n-acetylmuramoyl-l-alanine amidase [Lucifera butyrica]